MIKGAFAVAVRDTVGVEGVLGAVRRYFLFEGWTWDKPSVVEQRRASWPRWRRAVRPVGALAWWTTVVLGAVYNNDWQRVPLVGQVLCSIFAAVAAGCVILGVIDGLRWRRRARTTGPGFPG